MHPIGSMYFRCFPGVLPVSGRLAQKHLSTSIGSRRVSGGCSTGVRRYKEPKTSSSWPMQAKHVRSH